MNQSEWDEIKAFIALGVALSGGVVFVVSFAILLIEAAIYLDEAHGIFAAAGFALAVATVLIVSGTAALHHLDKRGAI